MRKYNLQNYNKYKADVEQSIDRLPQYEDNYPLYSRDQLIIKFLPLVENIAKKFSTSQQAVGTLSVLDLIQFGHIGLVSAVDRLNWDVFNKSENKEQTMKSFLTKRIKGAIRRQIDAHRGDIRIPEHKLNDIRKSFGKDEKMVAMFFNSIFLSIDDREPGDPIYDIPDDNDEYNQEILNIYLKSLLMKHLDEKEYQVLRLSYGLDCDKHSAKQIAAILDIEGTSNYVRVSELKKQAVQKLIDNVDHSQVI